ncbi:MAG: hypothetical protein WBG62_08910, partial [Cyclobacteriaceae bacterium]
MANYDFSTLNSTDLEDLVCDLLNANSSLNSQVNYKTFKNGKDKGIDLLYSSKEHLYDHVVQVKHYYRSGFTSLIRDLKFIELPKVKLLNPNKYLVATSVVLSVDQTKKIKDILDPFVKSLNDIYGKKDLNRLINEYPHILTNHFKLWFSSAHVLEKIINSSLEFRRNDFTKKEIKRRLRLFVETQALKIARDTIAEKRFIVITGEPGVGKTTLSEILVYEYIKDGYELIYVYDDIVDADRTLTTDGKKQIIYFDDFLGSNEVEVNKARGSETALLKVLRRIKNNPNKVFLFTTRKHILQTALLESEKLKRFNILAGEIILHLDNYTLDKKKQLLINHVDDSELSNEYKRIILKPEIVKFLINHDGFTPRSVEYITSKDICEAIPTSEFELFIKNSFNFPDQIWQNAYINQLKENDRILLNTLLSFGDEIEIGRLQKAFDARMKYEVTNNNKSSKMYAFAHAIKRLNGGFIYVSQFDDVKFINPSLVDFLINYIKEDKIEVEKIINSIVDISQITTRFFSLYYHYQAPIMPEALQESLIKSYNSFLSDVDDDLELLNLALVLHKYVKLEHKEEIINNILNDIEDWNYILDDYDLNVIFQEFITEIANTPEAYPVIQNRITEIIEAIVVTQNNFEDALETLNRLSKKYNFENAKIDSDILEE